MNIQIFGKSKCFDTKKAERYFKERRIKVQNIDLIKYGMSGGEFDSVLRAVGGIDNLIDWNIKSPEIDLLKYMADKTHGEIPIRIGYVQNPLGILDMMWETSDFYVSLMEEEQAVHKALDIITDTLAEYLFQMLNIGDFIVPVSWPYIWAPKEKGVYLADDTMSMISPEMYEEYGVTYNNRISDAFGGVMLHSCATKEKYFNSIMKHRNIRSINFAAQYSSSMESIFSYFGGKIVVIPHYCHTDNPQIGTVTEFLERVIKCWKPDTPAIIYIMEEPGRLKQQRVYDLYCSHFNMEDGNGF